ncbi:MAG: acetyl-CoA carboxylase biotin carboxyl carrier protein [Oligosphaeraceae bacterium]
MDLKIVHRLAQLMERHGLTEVELSEQECSVRLVRPRGESPAVVESSLISPEVSAPTTNDLEPEPEVESHFVTSPMPGTFYVARSPEEAPFVEEGQTIKPGRVVGIVEAMKVMNEIKSEFGGTVVKVLVPNGSPVEFGQRLFEIQ